MSQLIKDKAVAVLRKSIAGGKVSNYKKVEILLDEIEGKYKRLSEDLRQTLRLFGYYLFNGIISWEILGDPVEPSYVEQMALQPTLFSRSSCVYFNHLRRGTNDSSLRCAQWIRKQINSDYEVDPPFADWEIDFTYNNDNFWDDLKRMVWEIGEHRFQSDLLKETDFPEIIRGYAGFWEKVFAIWGNVIKLDHENRPINRQETERRVAQWIKTFCDASYKVEPAFEEWETELI